MQKTKYNQGFSAIAVIIIIVVVVVIGGGAYWYFSSRHIPATGLAPIPANSTGQTGDARGFSCEKYVSVAEINSIFGYEGQTKFTSNPDTNICKWLNQKLVMT